MSELLTLKEAARLAFVSYETIIYWIKTGRLAVEKGPPSKRSGIPYNRFVRRVDLLAASPTTKSKLLKEAHPGNLLTVAEISTTLQINKDLAYKLVNTFELEKHRIDRATYMVDGNELHEKLSEDPYYWYLVQKKPSEFSAY
tara:strand:- start:8800 stop:9225 length:426 start_codon:yes stop_codon:yes gene_type:complete